MKAHKDKGHVLLSDSENININVDSNIIKSTDEKLPGVNVDYSLNFKEHIDSIKKAGRKVNALSRILPYMNFEKNLGFQ